MDLETLHIVRFWKIDNKGGGGKQRKINKFFFNYHKNKNKNENGTASKSTMESNLGNNEEVISIILFRQSSKQAIHHKKISLSESLFSAFFFLLN